MFEFERAEYPHPLGLDHVLLSPEAEQALGRLAHAGNLSARDALAVNNLRLIWDIANKVSNGDRMELFHVGALAALQATQKWDPDSERATRLGSYLGTVCWREMIREHRAEVPVVERELANGGTYVMARKASLDHPLTDKEGNPTGNTMIDLIALKELPEIDDAAAERAAIILDLCFAAGGLTEREIESVMRMHGIDFPQTLTYEDLGQAMGLTRRGAWGVYHRALNKAQAGAAALGGDVV